MPHTLRLLIVDDHPVVRSGVAGLLDLEDDLEIVGEAADGEAAVRMVGELAPDVVLMDLRMPGLDGVSATRQIRADHPATQVLILTTYDTDSEIVRAVEAGATGYLLKDTPRAELVDGVRRAARGETVLAGSVAAKLMSQVRRPATEALTAREIEVLQLVSVGMSNVQIGKTLFIGEATVKTHLIRTFNKLEVSDRTHAVTVAMERGILPRPGE